MRPNAKRTHMGAMYKKLKQYMLHFNDYAKNVREKYLQLSCKTVKIRSSCF